MVKRFCSICKQWRNWVFCFLIGTVLRLCTTDYVNTRSATSCETSTRRCVLRAAALNTLPRRPISSHSQTQRSFLIIFPDDKVSIFWKLLAGLKRRMLNAILWTTPGCPELSPAAVGWVGFATGLRGRQPSNTCNNQTVPYPYIQSTVLQARRSRVRFMSLNFSSDLIFPATL
jgi:hypothetical protein